MPEKRFFEGVPKRPPTEEGKPKRSDEFLPVEEILSEELNPEELLILKEEFEALEKKELEKGLSVGEEERFEEIKKRLGRLSTKDIEEKQREDELKKEAEEHPFESYEPSAEEMTPFLEKEPPLSQESVAEEKEEFSKEKMATPLRIKETHGQRKRSEEERKEERRFKEWQK